MTDEDNGTAPPPDHGGPNEIPKRGRGRPPGPRPPATAGAGQILPPFRRGLPKHEPSDTHHALFRPPQGQDWPPERFDRIYVARKTPTGEIEEAPGWFKPEDLSDTDRLREKFGGGIYVLAAVRGDGTIYRRCETNRIAGIPKSLLGPGVVEAEPAPAPAPQLALDPMVAMFQMMMSESRAAADRAAAEARASSERTMAMMAQMMQNQAQQQAQSTQLLVAALNGQKVDVGQIVGSVAEHLRPATPPPAASPVSTAKEILELAKAVTPQKEETVAEVVGAIGQAMGGMAAMAAANPGGPPKPPPQMGGPVG